MKKNSTKNIEKLKERVKKFIEDFKNDLKQLKEDFKKSIKFCEIKFAIKSEKLHSGLKVQEFDKIEINILRSFSDYMFIIFCIDLNLNDNMKNNLMRKKARAYIFNYNKLNDIINSINMQDFKNNNQIINNHWIPEESFIKKLILINFYIYDEEIEEEEYNANKTQKNEIPEILKELSPESIIKNIMKKIMN